MCEILHSILIILWDYQIGKFYKYYRGISGSGITAVLATFIMTMMIGRHQIRGGESRIYSNDGVQLAAVTLRHRGDMLMSDDRATLHDVSSIASVDAESDGYRDVLIMAFTACDNL